MATPEKDAPTQADQAALMKKALAEPRVAEVMDAYRRAADYLPAAQPATISHVYFTTGANA
jgi:hypothetical protein